MITRDELAALMPGASSWQLELAEAMLGGAQIQPVAVSASRAEMSGKVQFSRWMTEWSALTGKHTHVLALDGTWCLTVQPVGFLWARVARPGRCRAAKQPAVSSELAANYHRNSW